MESEHNSNDEIQAATPPTPEIPPSTKSRGSFDVRSKRSGSGSKVKLYVIIGLVIFAFASVVIGFWVVLISRMGGNTEKIDESTVKADTTLQVDRISDQSMKAAKEEKLRQQQADEERAQRERERQEQVAPQAPASAPGTPGAPARGPAPSPAPRPPTPAERKMAIGLVMTPMPQGIAGSGATVAGSPGRDEVAVNSPLSALQAGVQGQVDPSALGISSSSRGSLNSLGGTNFSPTKAFMGPPRKYLLARRTYARCALYTEIITEQPGLTECRLTDPIYSADGSTVLAEAGAKVFGEQNVEMTPGQVRVFTAWTELEGPYGIRVPLNSLGAGPMGASGTEGWIDNHWRERFGGAVLLTIMQDGLQSLSNMTQASSGSGGYTINNTEQNVENMASQALENSINIRPTGHLSPGTVLTIIVARDVDFSSVYENR